VLHCVVGGSELESAKEASGQKTSDVAAGHVTVEEVSQT